MTANASPFRTALSHPPGRRSGGALTAFVALAAFTAVFFGPDPVRGEASATLSIYKNKLDSNAKRSQVVKVGKGNCRKGKSTKSYRFSIGKKTTECFFRLPVVGRSIEISGTGVLFSSTPSRIINKTYLALSTRQAGNGSRYQLAVFPAKKRFELRKVSSSGRIEVLARGRNVKQIKPPGGSNRLNLRAFSRASGSPGDSARIVARINGKRVALVDDAQAPQLTGRTSTFSIGSSASAERASGSFRSIDVRIPDPLG